MHRQAEDTPAQTFADRTGAFPRTEVPVGRLEMKRPRIIDRRRNPGLSQPIGHGIASVCQNEYWAQADAAPFGRMGISTTSPNPAS